MNCDISKPHSLPVSDSKLYKKSKRKRRRNKFFLSKFKKSNKKKFQSQNMSHHSFKTKKSHTKEELESPGNSKVMSNWYWSNYKKAVEWQDKHKIAHWKSCALALQEENRYLMQIIHSMQSGMYLNVPTTMKNLEKKVSTSKKMTKSKCSERRVKKEHVSEVAIDNEDLNDDEVEFEMSEEMIKFFEQSYKHKMDLKKAKQEKEELNAENEVKQIQENKLKRSEEMKLLYGDAASMIIGMETAVQLSFDRYCDTKSPKYWPNIPLRL